MDLNALIQQLAQQNAQQAPAISSPNTYGNLSQMPAGSGMGAGNPAGNIGGVYTTSTNFGNQQEAFQKGMGMADLQAQQQTQQNQEWQAGAPGRAANTQVSNALSQANLSSLPKTLEMAGNESDANLQTSKNQKMQAVRQQLYPFATAYHSAKTDDQKQSIIDDMKSNGITKIGTRDLDSIPKDKMDGLMDMMYGEQVNTPGYQQKIGEAQATGDAWVRKQQEVNKGKNEVADKYVAAKTKALEMASSKPENQSQWYAGMLKRMENGELSDSEQATLTYYQQAALAKAQAAAQNQAPQVDVSAATGMPAKPPVIPQPPKVPNQPNAGAAQRDLTLYKQLTSAPGADKAKLRQQFMQIHHGVDPDK